jgi:hypothetical protein
MPKVRGRVTGGLLEGYWRVTGGLLEGYWRVTGGYWRDGRLLIWMFAVSLLSLCCLFAVSLLSLCCLFAVSLLSLCCLFKQPKTAHHRRLWDGECVEIEV